MAQGNSESVPTRLSHGLLRARAPRPRPAAQRTAASLPHSQLPSRSAHRPSARRSCHDPAHSAPTARVPVPQVAGGARSPHAQAQPQALLRTCIASGRQRDTPLAAGAQGEERSAYEKKRAVRKALEGAPRCALCAATAPQTLSRRAAPRRRASHVAHRASRGAAPPRAPQRGGPYPPSCARRRRPCASRRRWRMCAPLR
jgi:hypothetical protein